MKKFVFLATFLAIITITNFLHAERVGKPGMIKFGLNADESKLFRISLKVDVVHRFIGSGTGGEVNYYVYDPNGTRVAYDMEDGSDCNIEFVPKLPGYYYLLAKNYSDDSATVVVRTN